MRFFNNSLLFDKDEGGGGGGENTALEGMRKLLEKHNGDAMAVVGILYGENFDLREKVRSMKDRQAPDGATILTGDDAQAWKEYQTLGKPGDLKTAIEERGQLQGRLAGMEREIVLRSVAEAAGYKPSVLTNLDAVAKAKGKALTYALKDETRDGKTVKVPYVKDGEAEKPLTEYAASEWGDFLPALTVQGNGQQQQQGTRFVQQYSGNGGGGKTNLVDTFLQEQETKRTAEKNPLLSK